MIAGGAAHLGAPAGWAATAPAPQSGSYRDDDYLRFTDRVVARLDALWDPAMGCYHSGAPNFDTHLNAALLTVHATAAARQWQGPARNDDRARLIVNRLTQSPPYWPGPAPAGSDSMLHWPGWTAGFYSGPRIMGAMIDPKVAAALMFAFRSRETLGLSDATAALIASEIRAVADGPFFRYPRIRLNQINWPLELHLSERLVTGRAWVLAREYHLQVTRFLNGLRHGRNLGPTYRFLRSTSRSPTAPTNLDNPEYADIVLQFLEGYDEARRAGMPAFGSRNVWLLRAWVRRALYGYWTHAGLLSWDTGMGFRRWMKGKYWAHAQHGLLAMAAATRFRTPAEGMWAKKMFDRGLALYDRMDLPGTNPVDVPDGALFGVWLASQAPSDDRMFAAYMAANAAKAVWLGLGAAPSAEPPPFYAFDADIGRLAVSTPVYATAVLPVNRGVVPYGGVELARLIDSDGDPLSNIGGRGPAAFGAVVRDRKGRRVLASQTGLRHDPQRAPLVLLGSPQGPIARVARFPRQPTAGPFEVLTAVGRRRQRRLELVTTHRFTRGAIDTRWLVRRRRGTRRYTVAFQFPSWGKTAGVDAKLADGTVVTLAAQGQPLATVPLAAVRRLYVRAQRGSYAVTLLGHPTGTARTFQVAPQNSAPQPGPTLELALGHRLGQRPVSLRVRLEPSAS